MDDPIANHTNKEWSMVSDPDKIIQKANIVTPKPTALIK
jgi:hypothetical protein